MAREKIPVPDFGNLVLVEKLAAQDPEFCRLVSMAHRNGLPQELFGQYANTYNDCKLYGVDCMITMTLESEPGYDEWVGWLRESQEAFTEVMMRDPVEPEDPDNITAAEVITLAAAVRSICNEHDYDVQIRSRRVTVFEWTGEKLLEAKEDEPGQALLEIYYQLEILL